MGKAYVGLQVKIVRKGFCCLPLFNQEKSLEALLVCRKNVILFINISLFL